MKEPAVSYLRAFPSLFLLFFLVAEPAFAQSTAWTSGGPFVGDRLRCLVVSPSDSNILFAGGDHGLFHSTDDGVTWVQRFGENIQSIAVSASDPDEVYAGSWDGGMFKSEDGGLTWTAKGLADARVNAIAVHPTNPDIVYAGTGLNFKGGTSEVLGVFKSMDGGTTWTLKNFEGIDAVLSLLLDTANPDHVYAGISTAPGVSSPTEVVRRSTDGGDTWNEYLSTYSTSAYGDDLAMTPAGYSTPTIYARVYGDGVYKSVDSGQTWTKTNMPSSSLGSGALAVDPNYPEDVFTAFGGTFAASSDGGASWGPGETGFPHDPDCYPTDISINTVKEKINISCQNGQGVFRWDNGTGWRLLGQPATGSDVRYLAIHPDDARRLYAVQPRDDEKVRASADGGDSWFVMEESPPDVAAVAIDPQNPSVVWVGQGYDETSNFYAHRSPDYGNSWTSHRFARTYSNTRSTMEVTDIVIHPDDSNRILVGSNFDINWLGAIDGMGVVGRSLNGGSDWTKLGNLISATMSLHPGNPNTLYIGKIRASEIYEVTDVWGNWQSVDITPAAGLGYINDIEVDMAGNVVVAAADGLRIWDGTNWAILTSFPPDNATALVIDHDASPEIIYAGTDDPGGVYVSEDGGLTWTDFSDGQVFATVHKLVVSDGFLFAGTEFGGVWKREAIATVLAVPDAPVLVSPAVSATSQPTDLTLDWSAAVGADTYQVQLSKASDYSNPVVDQSGLTDTSLDVTSLELGTVYYWRVRAENAGGSSEWSEGVFTISGVASENDTELPIVFSLAQNYPNPFNPTTTIEFEVPIPSNVRLTIHDALGRRVATLVDQVMVAGVHRTVFTGRNLPSGSYLYRLETPAGTFTRTLLLLK